MNNPSQTQNPRGGLSSTAFVPDMSAILQSQSPNRSKVEEWQNDDEENPIPTVIKVKTSSPPKTEQSPKKKPAYNHQNNATVLAIKQWYKIRGWSLLYPLIVSLYLVITEMNVNLRAAGYGIVIFCCIWCYLNLKNFQPVLPLIICIHSIIIISFNIDFIFKSRSEAISICDITC